MYTDVCFALIEISYHETIRVHKTFFVICNDQFSFFHSKLNDRKKGTGFYRVIRKINHVPRFPEKNSFTLHVSGKIYRALFLVMVFYPR